MYTRVHGVHSEGQGQGILPGYLKHDSIPSATQEHVGYPTICTSTFPIFCWVFRGTTIKQRAKGLAKICLIYKTYFHIFYRYMGKEYHYFVIILKYRVNSVSFTMQYFKS